MGSEMCIRDSNVATASVPHTGNTNYHKVRHLDLHVSDSALKFPSISQLELWEDGVSTISRRRDAVFMMIRASTRLGSARRPRRDGVAPRRSKYFIFALYLPLFQLILDVFILNTQELVFGWKVYDYVSYQRYRFSVRDQRCVSRRFEVWRRLHAIDAVRRLLCLLYTSPSPRDGLLSRMPSSA